MDDLDVTWLEEGIEIVNLLYDPCFMDSIKFVLKGNAGLSLTWSSNGSGNFHQDTVSEKWFYLPSQEDLIQGELHFYMDAHGYCLQKRDTLVFDFSGFDRFRNGANTSGPITVYPNPSTDWLTIDGTCPVDVVSGKVYDMLGRQIQNWTIQELPFVLSMESLATGVYILHVELANGRIVTIPVAKYAE